MAVLGCDPGLSGGLALISEHGLIVETMPEVGREIDLAGLVRWLKAHQETIEMAFIEKVSAMPKQGVSSTFKFGDGFGSIKGALAGLGIPFELVSPKKWMTAMHAGVSPGVDSKERSLLAASRLFPAMDFRANERCTRPHIGMVEAALIAEYGRRIRAGVP